MGGRGRIGEHLSKNHTQNKLCSKNRMIQAEFETANEHRQEALLAEAWILSPTIFLVSDLPLWGGQGKVQCGQQENQVLSC